MSKNILKKTQLADAFDKAKAAKKPALLTNTGKAYLHVALLKLADGPHPNFAAALKQRRKDPDTRTDQEITWANMAAVAKAATGLYPDDPVTAVLASLKQLKANVRDYVQFLKELASNSAFAAHMDVRRIMGVVDADTVDAGLDAMGEIHGFDPLDIPAFDVGDAQRAAPKEPSAANDDFTVYATSTEDAIEAIEGVQEWLGVAVATWEPEQQEYWQVAGLFPLGQRKVPSAIEPGTFDYVNIDNFDDYRAWQDEQFKAKRNRVKNVDDVTAIMAAAA